MSKLYEGNYLISSRFGPRTLGDDDRFHKGIDCVGLENKFVVSLVNGTVLSSQIITDRNNRTWEWGNYIKIDDGYGYNLFYCHLLNRLVTKGMKIKKGQRIGVEGNTGYSFGSHLHFEVRDKDNKSIDPVKYFKILEERELDILKEEVKRYKNINEMPDWMKVYVKRWVDKGYIKGNTTGDLDFTDDMIRVLIITERMLNSQA